MPASARRVLRATAVQQVLSCWTLKVLVPEVLQLTFVGDPSPVTQLATVQISMPRVTRSNTLESVHSAMASPSTSSSMSATTLFCRIHKTCAMGVCMAEVCNSRSVPLKLLLSHRVAHRVALRVSLTASRSETRLATSWLRMQFGCPSLTWREVKTWWRSCVSRGLTRAQ